MIPESISARAFLTVCQARPYYDHFSGLWLYKQVGEKEKVGNLITDGGRRTLHTFIYGTSAQRTSANLGSGMHWIGISNDASAPASTDTSLTAELSGNGLDRALGTVTLPTGSGSITQVQKTFTYVGGGTQGVQKAALFDAASSGNMAHELLFTQRTLATNDTLTLTFSITLT